MLALEELLGAFLEEEDMNLLLDQNLAVIALELESKPESTPVIM